MMSSKKCKIMFICHGNICRSPMAEFVFKDMLEKRGLSDKFEVKSSATSTEEIGNPIHYGTKSILYREKIPFNERYAVRITKEDCDAFDYLICMDKNNIRNMVPFIGNNKDKLFCLMDFTGIKKDVSDPWWTGNFDEPYIDIKNGCKSFLDFLTEKYNFS